MIWGQERADPDYIRSQTLFDIEDSRNTDRLAPAERDRLEFLFNRRIRNPGGGRIKRKLGRLSFKPTCCLDGDLEPFLYRDLPSRRYRLGVGSLGCTLSAKTMVLAFAFSAYRGRDKSKIAANQESASKRESSPY
jgi:hypothetical protein